MENAVYVPAMNNAMEAHAAEGDASRKSLLAQVRLHVRRVMHASMEHVSRQAMLRSFPRYVGMVFRKQERCVISA